MEPIENKSLFTGIIGTRQTTTQDQADCKESMRHKHTGTWQIDLLPSSK